MTSKFGSVSLCVSLSAVALGIGTGCSDDDEDVTEPICLKKGECPPPDSTDEVGDGDGDPGDGGDEEEYEFCTVQAGNGERTVYQCNGNLKVSMQFKVGKKDCAEMLGSPEWCREAHGFGVDTEPYEMPAVMACCDAVGTPEDDLLEHCTMDLVEQVCRSIPLRLESLMNGDDFPEAAKGPARNLLGWLKKNQQECYNSLHMPSSAGVIMPVAWKVNGGKSDGWWPLKDFTITVDKAVVVSASLPDDESEYLACEDSRFNNSEIFEERGPISAQGGIATYRLGDSFDVPLMGPVVPNGTRAVGTVKSVSQSVCTEPRCSSLTVVEDSQTDLLVIEDLNLFAEGPMLVTYGELPIEVNGVALRLYGASYGHYYYFNARGVYVIEPGEARFLVSGAIGNMHGTRWASNGTPITMQESEGGWIIDGFTVVYTDGAGETWEAMIPQTPWD